MGNVKCILPCAGLGSRIGMKPNESKEMLIDPINQRPVIDYSLDICRRFKLDPIIITRRGKQDLIDYVKDKATLHIVENSWIEGKEWPDTVLSSQHLWGVNNLLLLPDTRFQPITVIQEIVTTLELGASNCFALHKVSDISKWGAIKDYAICEKSTFKEPGMAWGLIGFEYRSEDLFNGFKSRGVWNWLKNSSFCYLDTFTDITRNSRIDSY